MAKQMSVKNIANNMLKKGVHRMRADIDRIKQKLDTKNIQRNKVIDMEDIKNFERENKIILPEEIVTFYTNICDGCKMIDGFDLLSFKEWKVNAKELQKEFEFEKYWIWEDDYDEERVRKTVFGNIELINIGDAQSWNIVVTGKQRGKMWFFTDVGIQPCAPEMSFLEWFEYWLDGNEDYFLEFQA